MSFGDSDGSATKIIDEGTNSDQDELLNDGEKIAFSKQISKPNK